MKMKVAPSCPTLCDAMDYTVHEILCTRTLEQVAFPFSRGCSRPRNQTGVSYIASGSFTNCAVREAEINGDRNWKPEDLSSLEINKNCMTIIGSSIGYGTSVEDYTEKPLELINQFNKVAGYKFLVSKQQGDQRQHMDHCNENVAQQRLNQ